MTPFDLDLQRLLKAASQAPRREEHSPPFGFESRVLAGVREKENGVASGDESLLVFLHRALLCGCGIMVLSLLFFYRTLSTPTSAEIDIANSAIEQYLP